MKIRGHYFGFRNIRTSIILSFMALLLAMVLGLSFASYTYTVRDFESLSINYTTQLLDEINASIDAYIDNMKNMGTVVIENRDVRRLMASYNQYHGAELTAQQQLERDGLTIRAAEHMQTVANTRSDITNIAVVSKYRDIVLADQRKRVNQYSAYNVSEWFLHPLAYRDDFFVSPSHVQSLVQDEYKWVISISKAVTDPETDEVTGTMVIDLNYRSIESICENASMEQTGYIYLMDAKENLIYHPQQQLIYSGLKSEDFAKVLAMADGQNFAVSDNGEKIYIRNVSPTTGWIAVGVINTGKLIRDRAGIVRFYLLMAYVVLVIATIVAVIISFSITRPIKALENVMHKVEEGDFSVRADTGYKNEIGHLSKTFNSMIAQIRKLMQNAIRDEEEKRISEITALQAQINPHFLYNTLDTIIWMSAGGKNDEVVEVTSALAHLFRTSISQGDSLVELRTEIANIQSYLTIQKMRYMDKLSYRINAPDSLMHLRIPKLILQPIVENAVYHGIKESDTGGEILITAGITHGLLILTVEDTGVGMSAEQISRLFEARKADGSGIGIINVHNRIQLLFGEQYGLSYQNREGGGTHAILRMPVIEREDN